MSEIILEVLFTLEQINKYIMTSCLFFRFSLSSLLQRTWTDWSSLKTRVLKFWEVFTYNKLEQNVALFLTLLKWDGFFCLFLFKFNSIFINWFYFWESLIYLRVTSNWLCSKKFLVSLILQPANIEITDISVLARLM